VCSCLFYIACSQGLFSSRARFWKCFGKRFRKLLSHVKPFETVEGVVTRKVKRKTFAKRFATVLCFTCNHGLIVSTAQIPLPRFVVRPDAQQVVRVISYVKRLDVVHLLHDKSANRLKTVDLGLIGLPSRWARIASFTAVTDPSRRTMLSWARNSHYWCNSCCCCCCWWRWCSTSSAPIRALIGQAPVTSHYT